LHRFRLLIMPKYKKYTDMKALITVLFILITSTIFSQIAWINELHYANSWTDVNEFVEIVVRNTGEWEEERYLVEFYDGYGRIYLSKNLTEFIKGDTVEDCLIYYYPFTGDSIQNGHGGMALSYDSLIINGRTALSQFISYGGIILGIYGAAKDMVSYDVELIENTTSSPYKSIQLSGEHFIWWGYQWISDTMSPGSVNRQQIIRAAPMTITYE